MKTSAVKITKKEFNATLVAERTAQIACCNGKVNRLNDIVAVLNDTEKMQNVKHNAEWRTVTKTRANGVVFSNGSTLDYKANAEYYRVGNVIIVVNVSEIEDFDAAYNRVNVPYYNVMAYLIDAPELETPTKTDNTMKANNTLKGQALRTYNKVMNAMAEDNDASMLHTFAALTQQAKSIALQSGKFSNAYVRGELKGMTAEEAAKDLTARAAACVTCKVRNIDKIIATAFLAEYISRQRKEIETPKPTTPETSETMNTDNTPETMNEAKAIAIYNRVDAMKMRGAWNNGVKAYALMLLNWYIDEASESPLTLETMLNGANNWQHYSRSGCGVAQCYNANIAETLCSPSELKRVKGGLKNPNSFEDWCDVEGRALFQA